jgi:mitogen-activated protein kinase kinase kinase 9
VSYENKLEFSLFVCRQELNVREDELNKLINQQKAQEQELQRREQQLRIRELDLVEREIHIMMQQQQLNTPKKPTPERRKGKFKKSRLKRLLKSGDVVISEPSGNSCL